VGESECIGIRADARSIESLKKGEVCGGGYSVLKIMCILYLQRLLLEKDQIEFISDPVGLLRKYLTLRPKRYARTSFRP